jgi:trk system potassium uptake protein TrkH
VRTPDNLRQRYKAILHYTGLIFVLGGALMLVPFVVALLGRADRGETLRFLFAAVGLLTGGAGLWLAFRRDAAAGLTVQEGGVIVLLSWVVICVASAWPLLGVQGLGFTQTLFESVSGWTTTGLSVLDVEKASPALLLWRSLMQLAGGAGLAIIMMAAIVGPPGPALSVAEGRSEQLVPHVRASAKLVLFLYGGYGVAGVAAYILAGMAPFDAVNHACAAISTGGFSTRPDSIGAWNSVAVEAVTLPLMILGNLNFITAYLLLHARLRAIYHNGEIRLMAVLLPLGAVLLFFLVCLGLYPTLGKSVRVAVFETVSALTTTGFSTVPYARWNSVGWLVLIVLMLIGGGTGSTAGGIKQYRVYVLFQSVLWEIRRALLPRTAVVQNYVWQGEAKDFITEERIRRIGTFVFLYLMTYVTGVGILATYGYGLKESLFEFASALGTVGLSVGVTGAQTPPGVLWTEIIGMFLGRLEFFVVIISTAKILHDLPRLATAPGSRRRNSAGPGSSEQATSPGPERAAPFS